MSVVRALPWLLAALLVLARPAAGASGPRPAIARSQAEAVAFLYRESAAPVARVRTQLVRAAGRLVWQVTFVPRRAGARPETVRVDACTGEVVSARPTLEHLHTPPGSGAGG